MSQTLSPQSSSHQNSAEAIWLAIADVYADCEQNPATLMTYALCDLRHLCDWITLRGTVSVQFEDKVKESLGLYDEEKSGD